MTKIKVVKVEDDQQSKPKGRRVTLEREDGKKFTVNIPDDVWGDETTYGLNLVFGDGDHYI